jgi:hypothetical protein
MVTRSKQDSVKTKTAYINPSTITSTEVVTAAAGRVFRVHAVAVVTTLANIVNFRSDTTAISSNMPLAANGGFVLPYNEAGWFVTASGEGIFFNQTAATATGVTVVYSEE